MIATYALCGFANLSSVAIQIGGIGALAPSRKSDLARLGMKAVACRDHGELHVRLHRGDAALSHLRGGHGVCRARLSTGLTTQRVEIGP